MVSFPLAMSAGSHKIGYYNAAVKIGFLIYLLQHPICKATEETDLTKLYYFLYYDTTLFFDILKSFFYIK